MTFTFFDSEYSLALFRISFRFFPSILVEARDEKSFDTVEDFQYRAKANKVVIAALRENDILKGLPETAQISLF